MPKQSSAVRIAWIAGCATVVAAALTAIATVVSSSVPKPARQPIEGAVAKSSGDFSSAISIKDVSGSVVKIATPRDPEVKNILSAGLPQDEEPVVDMSVPIKEQLQVFAEDKVEIVGWTGNLEAIKVGPKWEKFDPNSNHVYTVWGPGGVPITPEFSGNGMLKVRVSYTRNRDRPRDLRSKSGEHAAK